MIQIVTLVLVTLILNGCSQNEQEASKTLAVVNGDEITVGQLQSELAKAPLNENSNEVAKRMLTNLIDRQLLVQEALKFNLDRSPEVVQAIESSRAQIYAQAYMSKKLAKLQDVSDDEIGAFISHHPEMFAHRKLFKTFDVIFANDASRVDVKAMERDITTLESLEAELQVKNVVYDKSNNQFLTDRLPLSVLSKISQLQQGDLLFVHNENSIVVKSIQSIVEMPVTKEQAISAARKLLSQQKKQEFIKKEIDRLKNLSTIQIFNDKVDMRFH